VRLEHGYAMAALLVGLSVMAVLMTVALPVWSHAARREKEAELIWRGNQYMRAIGLFQRKFANTFPPSVDILVEQRFLRKKYKDPITNDDFQLLPAGGGLSQVPGQGQVGGAARPGQTATMDRAQTPAPPPSSLQTRPQMQGSGIPPTQGNLALGIGGVVSKSKETSIKIYNGRQKYNEWAFVYMQTTQSVGGRGGVQAPGGLGSPFPGVSQPGGRGGPGGPFGPGQQPPGRSGAGRPPVPMQPGQFGQPPFGQPPFGQPPFGGPGQPPFGPGQPTQRPRPPGS
jgi:type II secretory pathway pseudopilin PulG